MKLRLAIAATVLCLAPASGALAETLNVPAQYATIQAAVDAADPGDVVLVAPGIFTDCTHQPLPDETFCCVIMKSGVELRGSGIDQTIIDAQDLGRGIHFGGVTGASARLLTVRNSEGDNYGCGILVKQSDPHIEDVKAEYCHGGISVIQEGGGLYERCTFDHNAGKYGAGIDVEYGCSGRFVDCVVTHNDGPSNAGVQLRGNVVMERCLIDGNTTAGSSPGGVSGGGIGILGGVSVLRFCTITNNYSGGEGGGISFMSNDLGGVIDHCLIANNQCAGAEGRGGGIIVTSLADVHISYCTIANNSATGTWGDGGGMYVSYSTADISHCTFYGNSVQSTIGTAGNFGTQTLDAPATPVTMSNSILAFSPDGAGMTCVDWAGMIHISCCDVYGNAGGNDVCETATDCFSADPLFCDAANGLFRLAPASPCAPGQHPGGVCADALIGAFPAGCTTDVDDTPGTAAVALLGNQPNPFSRNTLIAFSLDRAAGVRLEVIDASGRLVALLEDGVRPAGTHHIGWDGTSLDGTRAESGVYFYRLKTEGRTEAMRMLRLR